ncbi:MAG TPA: histidine phosphatase family protein [Vicinamibacterales bacterium]|nr:histidine phosphatase family protein [Vicinamibacterales bacterium]
MNNTRTIALLIRHAQTDAVGAWLAGQAVDVSLNQCGRAQAERLRARLSALDLSAIYSSPLQRAIETAGPLARDRGLRVEPRMELVEVNFGEWTGERFDRLAADARWTRFNRYRSMADVPNGERAIDVQARVARVLEDVRLRHPNQTVALVSHADVIRLAVLHVAGAPLDFVHRVQISPASVTAVALYADSATLLYVNERDPLSPADTA